MKDFRGFKVPEWLPENEDLISTMIVSLIVTPIAMIAVLTKDVIITETTGIPHGSVRALFARIAATLADNQQLTDQGERFVDVVVTSMWLIHNAVISIIAVWVVATIMNRIARFFTGKRIW